MRRYTTSVAPIRYGSGGPLASGASHANGPLCKQGRLLEHTQIYKHLNTQLHKHTNTQTQKYTNTQKNNGPLCKQGRLLEQYTNTGKKEIHKYTNTQIHKYLWSTLQTGAFGTYRVKIRIIILLILVVLADHFENYSC